MPDLLLEIGVEELPAAWVRPALRSLAGLLERFAPLPAGKLDAQAATPRRLALHYSGLPARTEAVEEEVKGPPRQAAFGPDGEPSRALAGFLKKHGARPEDVYYRELKGREYCFLKKRTGGEPLAEVIAKAVPAALDKMTFPKSMRWNEPNRTFARPVRWIACVFGEEPVVFEWNGVRSGNAVRGHRILSPGPFELKSADMREYLELLERNFVTADHEERKRRLREALREAAEEAGVTPGEDEELLEVVNFQLEYPNAVAGSLDERYMKLPAPVLVETLKHHQYAFLAFDGEGRPAPVFLAACNLPGSGEELAKVRKGNEDVCRARLEDALFFYEEDLKRPLAELSAGLAEVKFHPRLGSYLEKCGRVKRLVEMLGAEGSNEETTARAARAAELARADLLTHMVYELPELQGVMGRIYALEHGEHPETAAALEEMYLPAGKNSRLPETAAGTLLSTADRLDTLAGFFGAGMTPTSTKDPFGLRRHTIAILQILERTPVTRRLVAAFRFALEQYAEMNLEEAEGAPEKFAEFVLDRLKAEMTARAPHDLCAAVLAVTREKTRRALAGGEGELDVNDTFERLKAITELASHPSFADVCTTLERAANITRDFEGEGGADPSLFEQEEERELHRVLEEFRVESSLPAAGRTSADYLAFARAYVEAFAGPLHRFFERVYVNAEDERVRRNRKALLKEIARPMAGEFADLTLAVKKR